MTMLHVKADERRRITLTVNGRPRAGHAEPRMLLADFLRHELQVFGVHVGCEHGVCGACTILRDGRAVRSCTQYAVQADGRSVRTVEGLAPADGELHPLQQAFHETHALQCGFCTPGFLMTIEAFLAAGPGELDDAAIRAALAGNLCRCTGYQNIVEAVRLAAERMRA